MRTGITLLTLIAFTLSFMACKEDEPPKSKVGFEVAEMEVKESNGNITSANPLIVSGGTGQNVSIFIELDRPVAETSVISIEVSGTASTELTADGFNDYKFVSDDNNIIIEKGEDSAEIKLVIYEDYNFEATSSGDLFETVEITLTEVISGTAVLDEEAKTFKLNILEDDAIVILDWDDGNGGNNPRGDADMDLFLYYDGEVINYSNAEGSEDYEIFNIPAYFDNGTYGLACTYYSGASDDLEFYTLFLNFGGTLNGGTYKDDPLEFVGNYDQDNINAYDTEDGIDPIVVQTMTKNGFNYSNISQINEPASGSRVGSPVGNASVKSLPKLNQEQVRRVLKMLGK